MIYNQTRTSCGTVMPLLMGCTKPQPIEVLQQEEPIIYDPIMQIIPIEMRIVGTYSLKSFSTKYRNTSGGTGSKTDRKNEIDDQKSVK
ncbi:hypothetical protein [Alistipes sp. An66]|uniref:hypothetical protein n=1 Tax=Alistipes sp. An66 TaxID=1965650 RepID=UPI000B3847C2|nr:hypothetical protein [Alistipes sp. An66]OUN58186.1 hypothetical protein B5G16_09550 [Alistipes sp. An66]